MPFLSIKLWLFSLNTKISYFTVKMVNILWYNALVDIIHF